MTDSENALVVSPALHQAPTLWTPTPNAARRVLEFFTAQINNGHTRKVYLNATRRFAEWSDARGIGQLADVHAFHVAALRQGAARPAVTAHREAAPSRAPHAVRLARHGRQNARMHVFNTCDAGEMPCRLLVIARDQARPDAERMQTAHRFGRVGRSASPRASRPRSTPSRAAPMTVSPSLSISFTRAF